MFNALVRGVVVMTHRCADVRHLVGGDADPYAAAAYQNPTLSLTRLQRFANGFGKIRIIRRLGVVCAQVGDVVTTTFELRPHLFFQRKSRMISGNDKLHTLPLCRIGYFLFASSISLRAWVATLSTLKPRCSSATGPGADAPKRSRPITSP